MTFGVLEKYRRAGFGKKYDLCLGGQLLDEVIRRAKEKGDVKCIYLHMWVKNEEGYKFYLSKGFSKYRELENYYQDIEPPHCYILKKEI